MEEKKISFKELFEKSILFKVAFVFIYGVISGTLCACFSLHSFVGIALGIAGALSCFFWCCLAVMCVIKIAENFGYESSSVW